MDYCEIDNLENNMIIPLIPLLREIKKLYNEGKIQCRLVLKNVGTRELASVKANVAPTPQVAEFIATFHIYEADDTPEKPALEAAMRRLKGAGAVPLRKQVH